jgi:hypothetical protein
MSNRLRIGGAGADPNAPPGPGPGAGRGGGKKKGAGAPGHGPGHARSHTNPAGLGSQKGVLNLGRGESRALPPAGRIDTYGRRNHHMRLRVHS